jgi:hypothetical protein
LGRVGESWGRVTLPIKIRGFLNPPLPFSLIFFFSCSILYYFLLSKPPWGEWGGFSGNFWFWRTKTVLRKSFQKTLPTLPNPPPFRKKSFLMI